ncbi:MAG: hypothetical protein CFH39_01421 [Alphaproteobacteria bacterium MarineAlpha10_Bin2]|nr:MAG: hypothetical protein CFH39_01421 [Alphaproteobacteria bacterium MarineAlpha10_Bin2]
MSVAPDNVIIGIDATCASVNAYDLVVTDIMVSVGDTVEAEQILMILEYNKVVTEVTAPAPGTVVEILCQLRDEVQVGERLINIRPY